MRQSRSVFQMQQRFDFLTMKGYDRKKDRHANEGECFLMGDRTFENKAREQEMLLERMLNYPLC